MDELRMWNSTSIDLSPIANQRLSYF